jgi:hypothetical protein
MDFNIETSLSKEFILDRIWKLVARLAISKSLARK